MDDLDALEREVRAAVSGAGYIAAASPDVVLALIAEVRAARAERDEARAVATGLTMLGRYIAREYGP